MALLYPVYSVCRVHCFTYSTRCAGLQRLLCGFASISWTAVAVSIAPILSIALVVWFCFYVMSSGCCVALPVSLQRLLCGPASIILCFVQQLLCGTDVILLEGLVASILRTAVAVWHCPDPVYSACCVIFALCYAQGLLCGNAPSLFTALAVCVWLCP